jgi:hypothetical protein
MNASLDRAAVAKVLDAEAIAANLACHSFGLDRRDADLIRRAYNPDATVAYGLFEGLAADFAGMIVEFMTTMPPTLHQVRNVLVRSAGDRAVSESYVVACMAIPDPDSPRQALIQGRYLDRHRRGPDGWCLDHRTYVFDWHLERPLDAALMPPPAVPSRAAPSLPQTFAIEESHMPLPEHLRVGLENVLARHAIHDLIMLQARATDRGDAALLGSVFHRDATVDVGIFRGTARDYCPFILQATAGMQRMSHTIANEWIDVQGDDAVAESYVVAFTTAPDDTGGAVDGITAGRYLDRFARRNGEWKFTERRFVVDFAQQQPNQPEAPDGMTAQLTLRGRRSKDDPVYALWNNEGEKL